MDVIQRITSIIRRLRAFPVEMRDRPEWMNKASEPVLEMLAEANYPLPAITIIYVLHDRLSDPPSPPTVYRTLPDLVDHDLLIKYETDGADHYEITDEGRAYLGGEFDSV